MGDAEASRVRLERRLLRRGWGAVEAGVGVVLRDIATSDTGEWGREWVGVFRSSLECTLRGAAVRPEEKKAE